ncbi:MAG: orotidine 5-phosphate decarboxylase, subfamily 2 [Candidatus Peribacteria bacterium]|nr:orotidine 5-phosphate decarboxylase, subfamily 2 [Candidatus Peribacteria bacterium]
MNFADSLTARTKEKSPVCVGFDPDLAKLPEGITKDADGVLEFGKGIIDAVAGTAAVFKPQLAFFEVLRWEGIKVFWDLCTYAKEKGLLVIADGKRGDIGSTCEAYAEAYLYEGSPIDALTVNPYLGIDGVRPFIERAVKYDKGLFVLVKTSNPSSGDLQDLPIGDEVVHEYLAQMVEGWGTQCLGPVSNFSSIGAVVGATYPEEMTYLRTLMPHIPFLIPGYGAQGGTAADSARGFIPDGTGAVVSATRSIIYASYGADWREAAGKATLEMAEELKRALNL